MPPTVEYRGVACVLGRRTILRDFTLEVHSGETLVLLGRSGSGKTTALKLVNRLLEAEAGEVLVEGRPVRAWDSIELRRGIGYVVQNAGLLPHMTVAENVGLVPRLAGRPFHRTAELLAAVGLDAAVHGSRYPGSLSGGQQQRVGVARALAADPRLLLFDEPFGAVDPVTRFDLQEQFLALRRTFGKTSIFVTHDISEALRLASRIALIDEGRLALVGEPAEFLRSEHPAARAFLQAYEGAH